MNSRTFLLLTGQLLLAATIISSTIIATQAFKKVKMGQEKIQIKGCAEKKIHSDFVQWRGTLNTSSPNLVDAYNKIENDLALLIKFMKEEGLAENEIEVSSIDTSTTNEKNEKGEYTNKIYSYDLKQYFSISSSNIPLVTKISQKVTTLMKHDLSITSYNPQYFYSKLDELKIVMLAEASKDARNRAEALISEGNGAKVGRLLTAHQGVFQITPIFSTSVSDYGEYDTSSIDKKIKAVVTVEYQID